MCVHFVSVRSNSATNQSLPPSSTLNFHHKIHHRFNVQLDAFYNTQVAQAWIITLGVRIKGLFSDYLFDIWLRTEQPYSNTDNQPTFHKIVKKCFKQNFSDMSVNILAIQLLIALTVICSVASFSVKPATYRQSAPISKTRIFEVSFVVAIFSLIEILRESFVWIRVLF